MPDTVAAVLAEYRRAMPVRLADAKKRSAFASCMRRSGNWHEA
jgi:hypothetical protein